MEGLLSTGPTPSSFTMDDSVSKSPNQLMTKVFVEQLDFTGSWKVKDCKAFSGGLTDRRFRYFIVFML